MMLRRRTMVEVLATAPVCSRAGVQIAQAGDRVETSTTALGVRVVRGDREAWVSTDFAAEHLQLRTSGDPVADAVRLLESLLSRASSREVRRVVVDLNDRVIEMLDVREAAEPARAADAA